MTSCVNAKNMSIYNNSSIVHTVLKLYLICLPNKGSICDESLDILRNTKQGVGF